MKKYFIGLILSVVLFLFNSTYPQNFTTTPYITISGNNYDVDALYNPSPHSNIPSFICWVNQTDSAYTLYLRKTAPDSHINISIFSDSGQIKNPKIAYTYDYNKVRIVWQSFIDNHWQILSRVYDNDSLTTINKITDSLTDSNAPAIGKRLVAWIQNGNLVYKNPDSSNAIFYTLDSVDCSNPVASKFSDENSEIIYEKGNIGKKQIYEAILPNYGQNPQWSYNKISNGGNNINPFICQSVSNIAYEVNENGVWKIVYGLYWKDTTDNLSYNCENPEIYFYYMVTKRTYVVTPLFLVYESDSLKSDREIIVKTQLYSDTTLNISNAQGDDYSPHISYYQPNDTIYVAIFWTHDQNGKKNIWMANSKFDPGSGVVNGQIAIANSFALNQNYPNPFNPTTIISWQLAKSSAVTLKIYNVLGNEITTLVNEYQSSGEHSITFDRQQALKHNLSSGIYFYQLKAGSNITAKKMMYLK